MEHIVIGIEGLVGAGKTSICRKLLEKIPNSVLLNGGNLYRAIVYCLLKEEKNLLKLKFKMKKFDIKKCMDKYNIKIKIENKESNIYINGILADEEKLQSMASSLAVSVIGGLADNSNLFAYARNIIDELKQNHNIIISGRSIMQIYPSLDYHIFITASLEERVNRKCIQYNETNERQKVRKNIKRRDKLQKLAGFYKIYTNTITVDVTECKDIEESTKKVLDCIMIKK